MKKKYRLSYDVYANNSREALEEFHSATRHGIEMNCQEVSLEPWEIKALIEKENTKDERIRKS